jgi:hypothetical protein
MTRLIEDFRCLKGKDLRDFISERLNKYHYFKELDDITVVIPFVCETDRWVAGRAGVVVIIEGFNDELELRVACTNFESIFGELVMLEYNVRGLYRPKNEGDLIEYEFSRGGVCKGSVTK